MDNTVQQLKQISDNEAVELCQELRSELIEEVSRTGGHLASNLGAVEIIVALHRIFNTENDRLVFDVGHQCYCHKILTGRSEMMKTLRSLDGLSGYPKPNESVHDAFIAGHASNSISVAAGMAKARTLSGDNYHVLALLGDGAMTGGLAYEGLSYIGHNKEKVIVILNDNGMSISKSVGGMAHHLARQRTKAEYFSLKKAYRSFMIKTAFGRVVYRKLHGFKTFLKRAIFNSSSMFEDMGYTYLGPVDGHDVNALTRTFNYAKDCREPVVIHVKTVKGKGYAPAEENPDAFHGVGPFDPETGKAIKRSSKSFSNAFGETLCEIAKENSSVVAITAAMTDGTGLNDFSREFPDRFVDVGIAEGHATSMAAGLAKQGMTPVFAVYSTFLQRGYDMLIHDISILNLHVIFGIDRAGLVGEDGETHHGIFDVAYLNSVPGMTILAPSSFKELNLMMHFAINKCNGPVAVRYPRGGEGNYNLCSSELRPIEVLKSGTDITIVSYGIMINNAIECALKLEECGISTEIIKCNMLSTEDYSQILSSAEKTGTIMIIEDVIENGSVGEQISAYIGRSGISVENIIMKNLGNRFITQGTVKQLHQRCGLDAESLYLSAKEALNHG